MRGNGQKCLPQIEKNYFKLADLIELHANEIGKIETNDKFKLLAETATQTQYVAEYYRYFAGLADKIQGSTLPIDKPDMHVFTSCEPIGVVAAVVCECTNVFNSN